MNLEWLFGLLVFLVAFAYVGYPLTLALLVALRGGWRRAAPRPHTPPVTILIAAYNEEEHLRDTILNKLTAEYPEGLLDVIVVSDASTDATDAICRDLARTFSNVRFLRQPTRRGKTAALNRALPLATGEILVFSDANSLYAPDAIRRLVQPFVDPRVGYVTGRLVYETKKGSLVERGCSAYMRYENAIRALESRLGAVVGVNGGIDAIRRELYLPLREDLLSDFAAPLQVVRRGYRVLFEPTAVMREDALADPSREYKMRVRVIGRTFHTLWAMRAMFNARRRPLFAYQLAAHKVLRYLVPECLLLLYATSLFLLPHDRIYLSAFLLQTAGYLSASAGYLLHLRHVHWKPFLVPFYFCLANLAALTALLQYLTGYRHVTWQPRGGN